MRPEAAAEAVARLEEPMVAFLRTIVDMDSPTEDRPLTQKVGEVLAEKAASIGLSPERDPQTRFADNWVCRGGRTGAPRVLMIGHFDTVYAAGTVAGRPFRLTGDTITGPGCLDMKGGLAIGLFALEALAVNGGIPVDVTFILNSDEEIGSPDSRRVILEEAARHDLALVLEPGRPGPALTLSRKGVGLFAMDVTGREAHAGAEPEAGRNAIVELAHKVLAVDALNDAAAGTTVTAGVVSGGTKPYVVPGAARLEIDARVPTAAEQARVEEGLARAAGSSFTEGTAARLTGGFHRPPMEPDARTRAFLARFQEVAAALGTPLGAASTGGASDGNLTAAAGVPTLDGLGAHGARAHSPDEYVERPSLAMKCACLAAFLASLADRPVDGRSEPTSRG